MFNWTDLLLVFFLFCLFLLCVCGPICIFIVTKANKKIKLYSFLLYTILLILLRPGHIKVYELDMVDYDKMAHYKDCRTIESGI